MTDKTPSREPDTTDADLFDLWWTEEGKSFDPDTDDVHWFDKRKGLAERAFNMGRLAQQHRHQSSAAHLTTSPAPLDHGDSAVCELHGADDVFCQLDEEIICPGKHKEACAIMMAKLKGDSALRRISAGTEPQADRPAADVTDAWRKPPPHFKPDPRWQRQPQSDEEWDAHKDAPGMREFRAKRRLAFAGDLADPRAPECMALVSRLDLSVVLSRLTWLEARFENTRDTALPPVAEPAASVPVTREQIERTVANCISTYETDKANPEPGHVPPLKTYISEALASLLASQAMPAAPRAAEEQA